MADQSELPPGNWVFPILPESGGRFTAFCKRHVGKIRTAEFAVAIGLAAGAWAASGDMFIEAPLLAIAAIVASMGIFATNIRIVWKLGWCFLFAAILFGESVLSYWHFHGQLFSSEKPSTVTSTNTDLNRKIKVECALATRPLHVNENRNLHIMEAYNLPPATGYVFNGGVLDTFIAAGAGEIKWETWSPFPVIIGRCAIANYSNMNLFRISLSLFVDWHKVIRKDNSTANGATIRATRAQSPEFDLGPSSRAEDYFYIANFSEYYIYVSLPTIATVYTADSETPIVVTLIPPAPGMPGNGIFLTPRDPTGSPPVAPPPTPTPQDRPEKK